MHSLNETDLEGLLRDALPPLHQQVRGEHAAALARRLARLPAGRLDGSLGALALGLRDLVLELDAEAHQVERQVEQLLKRYREAPDARAREAVLVEHLTETVPAGKARREDLQALRRWMGLDALRERLERKRHALLVEEETALRALGGLAPGLPAQLTPGQLPELALLGAYLLARGVQAPRVQNQLAALEALQALLAALPQVARALPGAGLALEGLVEQPGTGPFLQAAALEALLRLEPRAGERLLRRRLAAPARSPQDFLFRRQALEAGLAHLPAPARLPLLEEVAQRDPSEYVRQGVAALAVKEPGGAALLARLAGLLPHAPEPAPRVRAAAAIALAERVRAGASAAEALGLLADVLARDDDALVLRVTCDLVASLAEAAAELAPAARVREALARVRARTQGLVLERASGALEAWRRVADPVRHAWTRHLAEVTRGLAVGARVRVPLAPPPEDLPPLPDDERFLGAILADLSREDFGLYARRSPRALTLWRGDRHGRRAWRLLHELARPAPDKRQAHLHTTGRRVPGELRAHPGGLDEITRTRVPGERVHVAAEGGWGRHLPTVDDVLDLPLTGERPVHLFSSHGTTTLVPPRGLGRRLATRFKVTRRYAQLSDLRLASLNGLEPRERRRFVEALERDLGVEVVFTPWQEGERPPAALDALFRAPEAAASATSGGGLAALAALDPGWLTQLGDRLVQNEQYFWTTHGNGLGALGLFTAGVFTWFLWSAYSQRQGVREARARVPLCVGGWGTRGKSGTERLKAALFGGLGFEVFAKTTGSEAMFVHTAPGGAPHEFFIFRPYDKATIWEQRDMLSLGAELGTEVFLWECMALQPNFVELLQNDWMHDDVATLTNAYPDHEDIQGPAGADVARVITNFIPRGGKVVTSEDHFLPLFQDAAREKGAQLVHSPEWEADLLPEELLALFPYREHPRNVALVATLAGQLGVPRPLALALMAEHVQPEIGVLKVFPEARVRGRRLTFINGHSANERTGFMNNWVRTGLDRVDCEADPDRAVVTVVNNRWDRVARSQVFARLLVEDAPADRHVLIGTNLDGLQKYVRDALDAWLAQREVVSVDDLAPGAVADAPRVRLARELARLKVPRPSAALFLDRLGRYARGAGLVLRESPELARAVGEALADPDDGLAPGKVRAALERSVGPALEAALVPAAPEAGGPPEAVAPAEREEVRAHALYLLARLVVHARLLRALPSQGQGASEVEAFHRAFREAYRALFLEQLVPVHDPRASGDQVVDACARAVPPGVRASIMGCQNIKGTGLDWVYRWMALDKVTAALATLESAPAGEPRRRALEALEAHEDHGLVDTALARAHLPALAARATAPDEAERLGQLAERYRASHGACVAALAPRGAAAAGERALGAVEKALDYLDSVRRRRLADLVMKDLVHGRVSHARAALELRKLYERGKGGWLKPGLEKLARPTAWVPAPLARPQRYLPAREAEVALPEAPGRMRPELQALFERALAAPGDMAVPVPERAVHNALATEPAPRGPRAEQEPLPPPRPPGAEGENEGTQ